MTADDRPDAASPASPAPNPAPSAHIPGLAMLDKRRIEAEMLKHVHAVLVASHGPETAAVTIAEAVRRSSLEQARRFAAEAPGGTSLDSFVALEPLWTQDGALEIQVVERSANHYVFHVTRCRYAETYRAMGLGDIGHLLSCQRDGSFCEGYDAKLKLTRTQTIMQGASHCDFSYVYEEGPDHDGPAGQRP